MRVHHPLTTDDPVLKRRVPFVAVIDEFLSGAECDALVARIESLAPKAAPITTMRGFEMRPDVRNNDRVMFDDAALASSLWDRMQSVPPREWQDTQRDNSVRTMTSCGLNERWRGYRYSPGHRFAPHFDGAYWRNADEGSMLTVLLYLNDGYSGGGTAILDWDFTLHPKRGQALLFYHPILHEGQMVESGVKYALRTDVMYRARV
jgi:hypothetical protein